VYIERIRQNPPSMSPSKNCGVLKTPHAPDTPTTIL